MAGFRRNRLRVELQKRLLAARAELPTSSLARARRLAVTSVRGGMLTLARRLRRRTDAGEVDIEAVGKIASSFGELKGIAMKMGQILSYVDVAMPEEARTVLSVLQTHAQPLSFAQVQEIVQNELGSEAKKLVSGMDPEPMAAASIGQVHRACLPDGTPVAVKVQYPGIAKAIASDFRPAAIGSSIASFFFPRAKIDGFVREARTRFLEECDYLHEARRQAEFAERFANHPILWIPTVHPAYSTRRVLTSTLVEGAHLEEYLESDPSQEERDRLGVGLFEFYIGSLFKHGLYNCDPHPGNYLFCSDGRVAMLDFGCTRAFEPGFVGKLCALTQAVHADERDLLHRAMLGLGIVRDGQLYDYPTARRLLRSFYGPMLRDETLAFELGAGMQMREITTNKRELLKLALPGEFLFLLRIRFGLASVLARLGARANWYRLERDYLDRALAAEPAEIGPVAKAPAPQPTGFDVILLDPGSSPILVIRELRESTGIGIREAKALVEGAPHRVQQALEREQAEALQQKLEAAGGKVEIRSTS